MYKKLTSCTLLISTLFLACGCNCLNDRSIFDIFSSLSSETATQPINASAAPIRTPKSIVVCRSHQCAPAKLSMSKEYIYNSLLQLFDNNNYQKALICQADSATHTCLENYISIPLTSGITPTNAYIDNVKITDVIINAQASKINLILNYNVTYGGQTPECTPSKSILFAKNVNHVLLEDAGYTCKMTTIGQSLVKTVFAIDYIDLDYGYIGGFYSVGISGPAYGGSSGYMMLRLPKNAYPLSPQLKAPKNRTNSGLSNLTNNNLTGMPTALENNTSSTGDVQVFPISK